MTTIKPCRTRIALAAFLVATLLPLLSGYGDTVTLKDGSKLEGKITFEADDFIRIELSRSGTIKETKLLKRSDIQTISKTKPDVQDLEKIKENLPTRSLMTSSDYQNLIQSGPEAFLKTHPDSLLKGEVEKILEQLQAEKAKVDRGAIQLEGEWISAERRRDFPTLVKSKIRLYTMKQKAAQHNHTGAMRDFQVIEDQYYGTPAYPEAVKIALSILPNYGQLLTRQLKDVEFLNKKREADIKLLPPENQARTQAAFQKEQERFKALAEQEKNSGVKWRSVNRRNKESIAPMIATIRQELDRLKQVDTEQLAEQAKQLVKVDELINENKLEEAKELLSASGGTGGKGRRSSRGKGSKTKSSYSANLANKIDSKVKAAEEAAKTATASAKAKEVADSITQTATKMADDKEQAENGEDDKTEKQSADDAMDAVMAARQKAADAKKKDGEKKSGAKASRDTKKKPRAKTNTKRRPPPSSDDGGGISFQMIVMVFAGIMIVVIVVLKKMGIGGGKGGGDSE